MYRDTEQFISLLKPVYNDAVNYSRALLSNRSIEDAEDILQQSLLKALENFSSLRETGKFKSWFFKIITREFYNSARKSFWEKFVPSDNYKEIIGIPEIYDRSEQSSERILLQDALAKLTIKERSAILLFELAGFSIEEIKEIQKAKSISAVKSRLSRTRKRLKRIILALEGTNKRTSSKATIEKNKGRNGTPSVKTIGDIENETLKLVAELKAKK